MKRELLVATFFVIGSTLAHAGGDAAQGLSDKIMEDHPGTTAAGATDNPTARPDNDAPGIQRKAMKDHPGTTGGTTANPTAHPQKGELVKKP